MGVVGGGGGRDDVVDNVMKMEEHSAVKLAGLISPSSPSNLSTAEIPLRFASNHSKLQYLAVLLLQCFV